MDKQGGVLRSHREFVRKIVALRGRKKRKKGEREKGVPGWRGKAGVSRREGP